MLVDLWSCGPAGSGRATFPDAPIQLADDADREQAIDQLWAMRPGAERDAKRAHVVAVIAKRIAEALDEGRPHVAQQLLFELCALWRADPEAVGHGLADYQPLMRRLRAQFARSGTIEPTVAALVVLVEVDLPHRAAYLGELDEVLQFADELATAEHGEDAERGQSLALLQSTVLALPLPWLIDRYVGLLEERQRAVTRRIDAKQLPIRLVEAHHDVIHTAHRIANALARAGRISEIHGHLTRLNGIGSDRELAIRAEILADQPTADAYAELARALRDDKDAPDPAAALAVCLRGLVDHGSDTGLLADGAADAAALGRIEQPIALYEQAVQVQHGEVDAALALRLGTLYAQRIAGLALGGRPRAATTSWHEMAEFADRAARRARTRRLTDVWRQVAAIAEASLGRGLASQGQLADAERELIASLDRAPSVETYETLATIYLKTERLDGARRITTVGLSLVGVETGADKYHRAKLERLAGDIARHERRPREAAALYLRAMQMWSALAKDEDLPHNVAAEGKLELARALFYIGDVDKAVEFALDAVETDPDSTGTDRAAVAFLIEVARPDDAADAVHRALGGDLADLDKVYLCLWLLGDSHRRGAIPDRLATEYLNSRRGELWYEQLAQAATGRRDFATLAAHATTASRHAELAFAGTTLGLDRAASSPARARDRLEAVVRAGLVLDEEYDLARQYLAR
jgi:tetratricopeptide (TPR) repeat protein